MLTQILALSLLMGGNTALSVDRSYHLETNSDRQTITQLPTTTQEYTGIVAKVDNIARQITVRIATVEISSYGSGVIIAREGNTYYVATAGHVLEPNGKYQIVTPDGETYELDNQTIEESDAYDLAIFRFTSEKDYTVATVGNYTVGEDSQQIVFVSGFPKDRSPQRIITGGKTTEQTIKNFIAKDSYSLQGNGRGLLYSNLSYKGMSGGAILDSEGRLIGINTGAENELYLEGNGEEFSLGLSLGIPIQDVLGFIARETQLNLKSLQITNATPLDISQSDYSDIETQLLSVDRPQDNTDFLAWMNYGNKLWRYEKYSEAIDAFNRVITINPDFDRAYYALGLTHWYQKDYNKALTAFKKVTEINPNPYFYWRYLGYSYGELGRFDEAILAYERAITKNPQDFVLYIEQGDILNIAGRSSEALVAYNKALELNPNHSWVYNNRGSFYQEQGQYELALADLNKAIQLNPNDASTYGNRGSLYRKQGQYELALADLDRAIQLSPHTAINYNNRGNLYADLGEIERALADYDKAINLNPDYTEAYINRGNFFRQQKEAELALADFNEAVRLNPNLAEA